jgi:hypothetical protein
MGSAMKQATSWLVISGFAVAAWAHIYGENHPIHHALYAKHADKSVVAAVISEARGLEDEAGATFVGTLVVRVEGVVLDRHWHDRCTAELPVYHLLWPVDLVAPKAGEKLFLIVRSEYPEQGKEYVYTVLPRREETPRRVATEAEAQRILAADLLAQVQAERSAKRLVALLNELAPILARGEAEAIAPLLRHPDAEVRRSALAATLYATEDDASALAIGRDLGSFSSRARAAPAWRTPKPTASR